MTEQTTYDVDGYEAITSAIMDLLNQYPALNGDKITFSSLSETGGKSMYPVSGGVIENQRTSITGKVTSICAYPFFVVYRASGLKEKRKVSVKEWLDNLGRWLEKQNVTIDEQTHKLNTYPNLTDNRKFLTISRNTPGYLDNTNEDQTEDWVIQITARYQKEYYK